MKKTIFTIFTVLIMVKSFAQYCDNENAFMAEVGIGAGGYTDKEVLANLQLGAYKAGHHLYFNLLRPFDAKNSVTAAGVRYGYNIGKFEPSIGGDYHLINEQPKFDGQRGWKLAAGLAYELTPVKFAVGVTGPIRYISIIIFKRK